MAAVDWAALDFEGAAVALPSVEDVRRASRAFLGVAGPGCDAAHHWHFAAPSGPSSP